MSRVRVLYTVPELCVGGAERQLLDLARGLDRRRFDPAIAVLRPEGALEPEARDAEIEVVCAARRGRFDPMPALRLAQHIEEHSVKVVHSFLFLDGVYARLGAALARAPVRVASMRGIDYAPGSPRCVVDRALKALTTCLVANSEWMRRRALGWGMDGVRFEVIPNGVDFRRFEGVGDRIQARRELGLNHDDFVVGIVGRLSPEKDHGTFLRAAAKVAAECPRAAFVIVGDGPERPLIERTISFCGLGERVKMVGWRQDVPSLLSAMNVLALTSLSESFPNAILEAMAAALPVVATDVGGVAELVEPGVTALLASPGDADGVAQHLLTLANDGDVRRRMSAAGWRRARERFSLEAMVQRYERLYEELMPTVRVRR